MRWYRNFLTFQSVPFLRTIINTKLKKMRKVKIFILLSLLITLGMNQVLLAEIQERVKQETNAGTDSNSKVTIGVDLLSIEGSDSSLNLRVGNRGLNLLESLEGPKVNFEKYSREEEWTQDDNEDGRKHRKNRFRGHWTGVELGFNNYVTSGKSMVMPADIEYMTLNSSNSVNFNLNFSQLNIRLFSHFGIVTGLGLNFNNYKFDGDNNIRKGINNQIEILDPAAPLEKSKLATLFLDLPVLLELQIPVNNSHLNFAAGPIGAVKLGSHTKMVYQDGPKVKAYGDFSLNMLRYGATARVGFGNFQLYGTYYETPLFQTGKGPAGYDLYPFEVGFALTFNN